MQREPLALLTTVALLVAASFSSAVRAAELIPIVPVQGASTTTMFGIDNRGNIVGSYIGSNDGVEHGFFGTLAGVYTSFDAGPGGTEPRGINNKGVITGYSSSQSCCAGGWPMFERLPNGTILNVMNGGTQLYGVAQGINKYGTFAGGYWNSTDHALEGFLGHKGVWKGAVEINGHYVQASGANGINNANDIVGFFLTPPEHGFILDHNNALTVVDYPSPGAWTMLEGINDNGQAVGQWLDTKGKTHSFLFDIASSQFTDIKITGAKQVYAWGVNKAGAVAVSSDVGSYIWCKKACPQGYFAADRGASLDAPGPMNRR